MTLATTDTICAIATANGLGGVGIIRISGPKAADIATGLCGQCPKPRFATYLTARGSDQHALDQGIGLYFHGPNSFTGEHTFEFQGHGSPVVLKLLLQRCTELGARMAKPGEFSERAFLNGKIDLAQAEAIADLIESSTEEAAKAAMRSLQGVFSAQVNALRDAVIGLRVFVEASIDFPEEEIDFLEEYDVRARTRTVLDEFKRLDNLAARGTLLRDAVQVVLFGPPNVGKSSLLNALSQDDRAIVSDIAGTTRDVLEHAIQINGVPIKLVDTAGLRDSDDKIEIEGIKRAKQALQKADVVLVCIDDTLSESDVRQLLTETPAETATLLVRNKADLQQLSTGKRATELAAQAEIVASAHQGSGIDELCIAITDAVGMSQSDSGQVLARQRHLDALKRARASVQAGLNVYQQLQAGELLAEELTQAQLALGEITGAFHADDLLGEIFGSFCIGK